jgi:N-formylglutamate amidohydrolase
VGLAWPHDLRPKPQADFARNADFEVQTLYRGADALGAASVEAIYSRLVVDLNRAGDDVSRHLVPDHPAPRPRRRPGVPVPGGDADHGHRLDRPGRGVVWASAIGSDSAVRILDVPLRFSEFKRRIDRYHAPYYRALATLLERRRRRFGYAILLDAHSMPGSVGVDLVLGTLDGTSCAEWISRRALDALSRGPSSLLSVRLDDPYRGGEVVRTFGKPSEGIHALQLEVSRRLYMDEASSMLWEPPDDAAASPMKAAVAGSATNLGDAGTSASESRVTPAARRPRPGARATSRGGRDLAELLRRVRSLVQGLTLSDDEMRPDRDSASGTPAADSGSLPIS